MISKSYKIYISEGKRIFVFAIIFATAVRLLYFFFGNIPTQAVSETDGYLWRIISPFFSNSLYSVVSATLILLVLVLIQIQVNVKFTFIRQRTWLPAALTLFLFTLHPSFIQFSKEYIASLVVLHVVYTLFACYNNNNRQIPAFQTSFSIAIGTLFAPGLFLYFPLVWIGLNMMRSFGFKSLLASFFGLFLVFLPVLSYCIYSDTLELLYRPYIIFYNTIVDNVAPIINQDNLNSFAFVFSVIIVVVVSVYNYANRYKDKIKTRAYVLLVTILTVFAILLCSMFNYEVTTNVYIGLITGALLLSHFYALASEKWQAVLFYINIIVGLIVFILAFFYQS